MSKATTPHPQSRRLIAFVQGRLSERESVEIEKHVLHCRACAAALRKAPDDPLAKLLKEAGTWIASDTQGELAVLGQSDVPPSQVTTTGIHDGATLDGDSASRRQAATAGQLPTDLPEQLASHPRYRILDVLGAGGMGAVYKAQHRLMERLVALKVIRAALVQKPAAVERFRREVRAAARLSHPNIVTAYDAEQAGSTHFLVMEFVEGKSLAELVQQQGRLSIAQACDYVRQVALGLQHAYRQAMVHRDIKPSNLIVTADGQVKILDFGLARFASEAVAKEALTESGAVLGTADFIAPEQARDARSADIRADIYSLGCTLYYLLVGHGPFPEGTLVQKLVSHLERTPKPLSELRPDVPAGLIQIVQRMMAKGPADRFQTPQEVAGALAPFAQKVVPPLAPPPLRPPAAPPVVPRASRRAATGRGQGRITGKARPAPSGRSQLRRPRWRPAAAVAAGLLLLLLGAALLGLLVVRIATGRGDLVIETDDPNIQITVKQGQTLVVDRTTGRRLTLRPGRYQIEVIEGPEGLRLLTKHFTLTRGGRQVLNVRQELEKLQPTPTPPTITPLDEDLTDDAYEWKVAAMWAGGKLPDGVVRILGDSRLMHWAPLDWDPVAISPDGKWIASGARDHTVCLWDDATGRLSRIVGRHDVEVGGIAFHPAGQLLASGDITGKIKLWDVRTGAVANQFQVSGQAAKLVFSPDGNRLASTAENATFWLFNTRDGTSQQKKAHEGDIRGITFSRDGKRIATCSGDCTIKIWDAASLDLIQQLKHDEGEFTNTVAFHPDGRRLASASWVNNKRPFRIWDLQTGDTLFGAAQHGHTVLFRPDGSLLAVAAETWELQLRNSDDGQVAKSVGIASAQAGLAFSPDGKRLVSGGRFQNAVNLWDVPSLRKLNARRTHEASVRAVVFSHDGRTVFSCGEDGKVLAWDVTTAKLRYSYDGHHEPVRQIALSSDGRWLATASMDDTIQIVEAASGKLQRKLSHPGDGRGVAFQPNGRLLASAGYDGTVRVWNYHTGQLVYFTKGGEGAWMICVAFSPDGKLLACGGVDRTIRIFNAEDGQLVRTLDQNPHEIQTVAFSPDGKWIAAACHREDLWQVPDEGGPGWSVIRNVETGQTPVRRQIPALSARYSPDGAAIAVSGSDGSLSILDAATGATRQRWQLGPPGGFIRDVAFSPDGKHLATANGNGTVYIVQTAAK